MSTINLVPDDYRRRRAKRGATFLCLALFGVTMAGVAGAIVVSNRNLGHTRQTLARVNEEYARAADRIEQMHELQAQRRQMEQRAKKTAALVERVPRSTVLAVLTNARPPYTSLTELSLQTREDKGAGPGGSEKFAALAAQRGAPRLAVTLLTTGLASTDMEVSQFLAALNRHPLIREADLVYSQAKAVRVGDPKDREELRMREFKIRLLLRTDADAMDLLPPAELPAAAASAGPAGGDA